MDYDMEELIPIVTELAKKYAGCDSTSITYENAQKLMEGVIFCLNEYQHSEANTLYRTDISITEQYRAGARLVCEKAKQVLKIYNEMTAYFDAYNVICLQDTVQKGIPEFLKWYDAKFFPQNTILTLDYPILKNLQFLCGVDAVYEFMRSVQIEQKFLKQFDRNYILSVLNEMIPDYEDMIENIPDIVLLNTIGHTAIGKPVYDHGFQKEEYEKLAEIFSFCSREDTERLLKKLVCRVVQELGISDTETCDYLCSDIGNMAVRIENAVRYHNLDKIFLL